MPIVRFLRPYTVKDAEARHYAMGQEVDMSDASALHFVTRKAAVIVENSELSLPPDANGVSESDLSSVVSNPQHREAFKAAGIATLEDLAAASVEDIDATDAKKVGPKRAAAYIDRAKEAIGGN